jgi:hypothetical protein
VDSRFGRISFLKITKPKNTNDRLSTFRAYEDWQTLVPLLQMLIQFLAEAPLEFFQLSDNVFIIFGQFGDETPCIQIVEIHTSLVQIIMKIQAPLAALGAFPGDRDTTHIQIFNKYSIFNFMKLGNLILTHKKLT